MENFKMVEVKDAPRVELHNLLGLTGCEISINELPAKAAYLSSMLISRTKKSTVFWAARASSILMARSLISKQVTGL